MSYIDQQLKINRVISNLSQTARDAVQSIDVVSEIYELCKKYELILKEIGNVCEQTANVISGETRIENFVEKVKEVLEDENKEKANEIASEINAKILTPIRNALKGEAMGNLVPNPFEGVNQNTSTPVYTKTEEKPKIEYITPEQTEEKPKLLMDEHGPYDKDHLLREIENPTPYEITTAIQKTLQAESEEFREGNALREKQKGLPPSNLPTKTKNPAENEMEKNYQMITGKDQIKPVEAPILRTMSRDMASAQGKDATEQPNLPNRGKFGTGLRPPVKNFAPQNFGMTNRGSLGEKPTQTFVPPTSSLPTPKPTLSENPLPTTENMRTVVKTDTPTDTLRVPPKPPEKIDVVQNVVEDKLTKTVSIPSEKRRYTVDPYREPVE